MPQLTVLGLENIGHVHEREAANKLIYRQGFKTDYARRYRAGIRGAVGQRLLLF